MFLMDAHSVRRVDPRAYARTPEPRVSWYNRYSSLTFVPDFSFPFLSFSFSIPFPTWIVFVSLSVSMELGSVETAGNG